MTGSYVYCIAPGGHEPADGLRGLDEERVIAIESTGFSVWSSPMNAAPPPSVERIRTHDRVVRASTTDSVTPLPMRFGQWFATRDRLESRIGENREPYRRTLRTLAGALEFGVRVIDPRLSEPEEKTSAGSGREYLETLARERNRRKRIEARGEDLRKRLRESLDALVRAERALAPEAARELIQLVHLVPRENFDAYTERISDLRGTAPELRFLLSGPWPPYSFVE